MPAVIGNDSPAFAFDPKNLVLRLSDRLFRLLRRRAAALSRSAGSGNGDPFLTIWPIIDNYFNGSKRPVVGIIGWHVTDRDLSAKFVRNVLRDRGKFVGAAWKIHFAAGFGGQSLEKDLRLTLRTLCNKSALIAQFGDKADDIYLRFSLAKQVE